MEKVKTVSKKAVKKVAAKPAAKKVTKGHPERSEGSQVKVQKRDSSTALRSAQNDKLNLSVALFDNTGKAKGTVKLPEAVFGGKINPVLMAQAVRVYLANQRMGAAVTKTRGEVDGSTRKIYRQKGTGRARHGGIRAPLFVGGGIAHGPKKKDYSLDLPVKMRKAAVVSALSSMARNGKVVVVAGMETLKKTKQAAAALQGMGLEAKKTLVVTPGYQEAVLKAVRNIDRAKVAGSNMLTTYDVLNGGTVIVMQEALETLEKQYKSIRPVRQAQGKQARDGKESK